MAAVPLMQPSASMVDMPCATVSAHVDDIIDGSNCSLCPEDMQVSSDQEINRAPASFHFCCAPVLGIVAQNIEIFSDPVFFRFTEPHLPSITQHATDIFRPPRS